MLAVMFLNQHRISSSKTVRSHAPCCAQYMRHAVRTWSAVCSEAPHLQFSEGTRPHLCLDEWNCPAPVCRQVELNPSCSGQAHPNRPGIGPGYKNMEPENILMTLRLPFMICPLRSTDAKSSKIV